jgi:hypothetical protein
VRGGRLPEVDRPLRIMGGDADVDNFPQATYADTNDLEAEAHALTEHRNGKDRVGRTSACGVGKERPVNRVSPISTEGTCK